LKAVEVAQNGTINRGEIVSAMLGLAGVRRADVRQRVRERIAQRLGIKSIEIVTDAEIAFYGTTLGKAGVVIIAGTGSVCYGKNEQGEVAIAGGWGPLAGDEGGGISIARRGLQAIAKASDGRGRPTKLSAAGTNYFRTSRTENLLTAIYAPQMDNAKIAGFARFVVETAQAGDIVAIDILSEAGLELGLAANAVLKKLKLNRKKIPIGYVGSIFQAGPLITDALLEIVHQSAPKAYITEPILQPGNAAAHLGLLFQVTDDLLDVTQTTEVLGKTAGKDTRAKKATYPAVYGLEETRRLAEKVHAAACKDLEKIERETILLREIADFILRRKK
jgi:N-acetylglucosamine kinase-like BadF-type ATPase